MRSLGSRAAVRRVSVLAGRAARRPFPRLVAHFLRRMIYGSGDADSGSAELGAGPLLGLLAAPGGFQCLLMLDKYSSLLNWFRGRAHEDLLLLSAPDKYMFLTISMSLTGIVAVMKWDRILPDAQDYLNLAPLPLRPRTILSANVTAMAIAAAVIAVTVNGASMLLFPVFVSSAAPAASISVGRFAAVHALCVLLASLFTFAAVLAVLGVAATVLPHRIFSAWAAGFRAALLIGFVALLLGAFDAQALIGTLVADPASGLRWLPSLWYLGLYQSLQQRGPAAVVELAPMAWTGLGVMLALTGISYKLSYGRRFRSVPEAGPRPGAQRLASGLISLLDRMVLARSAFDRALCRFVFRGLLRNEAQRLSLLVPLGLGWLLAAQYLLTASAPGGTSSRAFLAALAGAPFLPAYLVTLGLRIGFDMPAALPANWFFRSALNPRRHSTRAVVRHVASSVTLLLVLLPASLLWLCYLGVSSALLHSACLVSLSLLHAEILFGSYQRLPFTCALPPFRQNLPIVCLLHLLGLALFVGLGTKLQVWLSAAPLRIVFVAAIPLAIWWWNETRFRKQREEGDPDTELSFEHRDEGALEMLSIAEPAPVRAVTSREV